MVFVTFLVYLQVFGMDHNTDNDSHNWCLQVDVDLVHLFFGLPDLVCLFHLRIPISQVAILWLCQLPGDVSSHIMVVSGYQALSMI